MNKLLSALIIQDAVYGAVLRIILGDIDVLQPRAFVKRPWKNISKIFGDVHPRQSLTFIKPRTRRMTRHFYDLEKLMHTPYADIALKDSVLYHEIVEHRRKFYHVGYVDYDKELPGNIQIVPSEELIFAYEADYNEMKESFIYGQSLAFSNLMERMEALQKLFRDIDSSDESHL
ncbi:MAG: nucleotidyl transferase AbiEii/AbiGii toxin family protein [Bacteroidales bacterium]|nr:nucleotidyl transferase AbiEii/AbiGii toxin family protein [Bacteroidales bacterium]